MILDNTPETAQLCIFNNKLTQWSLIFMLHCLTKINFVFIYKNETTSIRYYYIRMTLFLLILMLGILWRNNATY